MGSIYVIRNEVNPKVYVGQTTKTVEQRWKSHLVAARNDSMSMIHCAMRKHGVDKFKVELLEEVADDLLDEREKHWITELGSYEAGYNATIGGASHPRDAQARGDKIGQSLKGHVISEETRKKIAASLRGRRLTEDHRAHISASLNDPKCKALRSAISASHRSSIETKTKIGQASRRTWQDVEYRRRMCDKRRGSGNARAKMTEADVLQIKRAWSTEQPTGRGPKGEFYRRFAELNGVSPGMICRIIIGRAWIHLA